MRSKLTIQRILKVNHAGEYGAIRIYRAQLVIARILHPDLTFFLRETLSHEIEHCRIFSVWLSVYEARPCRAMWLWSAGGFLLGFCTALFGRNAIMICTKAVEETVHKHMKEQIVYLHNYDTKLEKVIEEVQIQELEHLAFAQSRCDEETIFARIIHRVVTVATDMVIWLSTWGDITRMRNEIHQR